MKNRFFNKLFGIKPGISYGITVCNEYVELENLLLALLPLVANKDEVIVLKDVTVRNSDVERVLDQFKEKVRIIESQLNNDFGTFKNLLIDNARKDYLFQIDADEIPQESLILQLKHILIKKWKCDCFFVPRMNIVEGYTQEHIERWSWKVGINKFINYPDYQPRIIKLNGKTRWKNKVHEELYGFKRAYELPFEDYDLCLVHIKDIERQEKQNNFYDLLAGK